ncbi:MAG: hypothetical protein HY023_14685 [Chloroflexi bacterium]|nr:hypothetical protein [Chloroflexota bacterium]MBI3764233.1 hypothetical protein [Chloroflexota bacterium]
MSDRVELRALRACEAILQSESLMADLADAEAATLLEWGLARAEACARATAQLTDARAKIKIDRGVSSIRKSMRRINALMSERIHLKDDQFCKRLQDLIVVAAGVPVLRHRKTRKAGAAKAVHQIQRLANKSASLSESKLLAEVLALADDAAERRAK